MSQKLPTGGFRWLSDTDIKNFDIHDINEEHDDGWI